MAKDFALLHTPATRGRPAGSPLPRPAAAVGADPVQRLAASPPHPIGGDAIPLGPVQRSALPGPLRTGMENVSGIALADVQVYRNSFKPARLQAHAFAQGNEIHLGPGQDHHLPHELAHVVQQRQGRVPVTGRIGATPLNDDPKLEREADTMGVAASTDRRASDGAPRGASLAVARGAWSVAQCAINPDWSAITKVTQSGKGTQVGVFFVTGADGTDLVIKFEDNAAPEAFASEFVRTMSKGEMGPEASLVAPDGDKAGQLRATLDAMALAGELSDAAKALREKLASVAKPFVVMERAKGVPMHYTDNPDPKVFNNPSFIRSLGELGAYDVALANYDRVLMGLNLGNLLHDPQSGRTTGIDQTARVTETEGISGQKIVRDLMATVGNAREASNWALKIAKTFAGLYEVEINPHDLDTGFMAGMLKMREEIARLPELMRGGVARAAGEAAGATMGRLAAYLEALEPERERLAVLVKAREDDIARRTGIYLEKLLPKPSTSTASSASKKKDCFLTTACIEARQLPDDCLELRTLRRFRDGFMRALPDGPAQIEEYYRIAPPIVAAIDAATDRQAIYDALYRDLVQRSVLLIQQSRRAEAMAHYRSVVLDLKHRFLDLSPGAGG